MWKINNLTLSMGYCKIVYIMEKMYQRDSDKAFENAKSKGLNKPGDFMYMYSKENKDFFKNIMDRKYISFEK